jgi:hypothetical protein
MMNKTLRRLSVAAVLAAAAAAPALAADVGVSVSVGQPGFYGRIDIGNTYPQPVLMYPQPVVIQPAPVAMVQQPIYLHVPPGHAKNWAKHCGKYNACGQRVYFVQDNWYNNVYVPAYRQHGGGYYREDNDRDRDHGHGNHGHGNHGKGHGKGRD